MLMKKSRSFQKDQYKSHLMSDSASESSLQSDVLGLKHKSSSSLFSVPGLFVGFTIKGLSDSDSTRSPTSTLDSRIFSNLGNPLVSPRSCLDGPHKKWDYSKVGLSIVDSLIDETKPSGEVLRQSESRNILFGSQMRTIIPNSRVYMNDSSNSFATPKSLPKDYAITPYIPLKFRHHMGSSEVVFGIGESQLESNPFGKIQSFLPDSGNSDSTLTGITYHNPNLNSQNFWLDKKTTREGSSPALIGGGPNLDNSLGLKPSSLPMFIGSANEFLGSLSASEIELSEDYTCVISHGPNPRTTHIFGDCILECHTNELVNCNSMEEQEFKLPKMVKCSDSSGPFSPSDFLSFCCSCKKKLEVGKDTYMYRGEKAFCSCSCRSQEILIEEEMEKTFNNSSEDSTKSTYQEEIFSTAWSVDT